MSVTLKTTLLCMPKCIKSYSSVPGRLWRQVTVPLSCQHGQSQASTAQPDSPRLLSSCVHWTSLKHESQLTDAVHMQKRFYNRRKSQKIPPTKVLNFDYGGDLVYDAYPLDLTEPKLELDGANQLEMVDDLTRRLLSIEYGDGQDKQKRRIHNLLAKVKEHPLDVQSLEVIIAYQTVAIRNQVRHVLSYRKDKAAKVLLVRRLQARKKHLKKLRRLDIDKFTWLCEELQMKYVPIPQYNRKPSRAGAIKTAARGAAMQAMQEKMGAFKERLAEDREAFTEYKQQELDDIEQQLAELDVDLTDDTNTMVRVYNALRSGDVMDLDNPLPILKPRRYAILEHKFELAAAYRKKQREEGII